MGVLGWILNLWTTLQKSGGPDRTWNVGTRNTTWTIAVRNTSWTISE